MAPLALALLLASLAAPAIANPPNILIVIADDVGIEHLSFYDIGLEGFADTTELNEWSPFWLLFRDTWSMPACSPTRSTILTGRYPVRHGVGKVVNCDDSEGLHPAQFSLLPEILGADPATPYATAAFGKFHMGTDPADFGGAGDPDCEGTDAPIVFGFDHFEGVILDQQPSITSYFDYTKTTIGSSPDCTAGPPNTAIEDGYLTDDTAEAVKSWIDAQTGPWFAWVAFTAAHKPFHCPPASRYPGVDFACDDPPPHQTNNLEMYRDMIRALSIDIDELLSSWRDTTPRRRRPDPRPTPW